MFGWKVAEKIATDLIVEDSAAVVVVVAAAAVAAAAAAVVVVGASASKVDVAFVAGRYTAVNFVIAAVVVGEQPVAFLEFVSGNQETYFACWHFGQWCSPLNSDQVYSAHWDYSAQHFGWEPGLYSKVETQYYFECSEVEAVDGSEFDWT